MNTFPFQNHLSRAVIYLREITIHVGVAQHMNNQLTSICRPYQLHDIMTFGENGREGSGTITLFYNIYHDRVQATTESITLIRTLFGIRVLNSKLGIKVNV